MLKNNKKLKIIKKDLYEFVTAYFEEIRRCLELLDKESIEKIIEVIIDAYHTERTIYILGNGGAASTSSHLACDLGKGTLRRVYDKREKRLRVVSLTDNVALITAYSNDISYDNIFLQQLRNLVEAGDVVIGISGSGNSTNVLRALRYAKKIGAVTVGFSGFSTGGKLASIVDVSLIVKSNHYGPIEDVHHIVGHIISAAFANIKRSEAGLPGPQENKAVPFYTE